MRTIDLAQLHAAAKSRRPGYLEAVMSKGASVIIGNRPKVRLSNEDYDAIAHDFATELSRAVRGADLHRGVGLGDIVGAVATPIARALDLDCIDPATKQLKANSPCQKRKDWLNRLGKIGS